jgi:hypothetical protein
MRCVSAGGGREGGELKFYLLYCFEELLDCGDVVYGCGARAVHARFPMKDVSGVNFHVHIVPLLK